MIELLGNHLLLALIAGIGAGRVVAVTRDRGGQAALVIYY